MIQFNKLEVNSNKDLVVDVSVKDKSYYENVYLGDLYIDTQDTYKDNGPSDKALKFSLASTKKIIESSSHGPHGYSEESKVYSFRPIDEPFTDATFTFNLMFTDSLLRLEDKYTLNFIREDTRETLGSFAMEASTSNVGIKISVTVKDASNYLDKSQTTSSFTVIIDAANPDGEGGIPDVITFLMENSGEVNWLIDEYVIGESPDYNLKSKSLEIPKSAYPSLDNNILYVYAKVSDASVPASDTPCGEDNVYSLGVVVNNNALCNKGISYIKTLGNTCNIPKDFISYVLEYNAFNLALKTKNYLQANNYWNKFFKNNNTLTTNTKNCGCNK